jgi:hypothetical protein
LVVLRRHAKRAPRIASMGKRGRPPLHARTAAAATIIICESCLG